MFKLILLIISVLSLFVYCLIKFLYKKESLIIDPLKVKYILNNPDYFKKNSEEIDLFDLPTEAIFSTNKKWSTKNNNYLFFNDRYYIIEPGYYYSITPDVKLFLNNNCKINLFKKNKKGN